MDQPQAESTEEIKAVIHGLLKLQYIDDDILNLKNQIEQLAKKTHSEEDKVKLRKEEQTKAKDDMDQLLKDRREAEVSSKQLLEQASKLSGQLFDVKTNEALHALQKEIQQKKDENGLTEERILEMMMSEDDMKVDVKKADEALKAAEQELATAQQASKLEVEAIDIKIKEFQTRWEEAAKEIAPNYLDRYVKLRDARGGMALAKVENDICGGCKIGVPPQIFIELKKYRSILLCDNCARILYTED